MLQQQVIQSRGRSDQMMLAQGDLIQLVCDLHPTLRTTPHCSNNNNNNIQVPQYNQHKTFISSSSSLMPLLISDYNATIRVLFTTATRRRRDGRSFFLFFLFTLSHLHCSCCCFVVCWDGTDDCNPLTSPNAITGFSHAQHKLESSTLQDLLLNTHNARNSNISAQIIICYVLNKGTFVVITISHPSLIHNHHGCISSRCCILSKYHLHGFSHTNGARGDEFNRIQAAAARSGYGGCVATAILSSTIHNPQCGLLHDCR